MLSLKACLLNRRVFLTLCKCEFHVDSSLHARRTRVSRKPSFSKVNEEFLNDDPERLEYLNEEDSEGENLDFMKSHLAYDSHVRERERWKDKIGKIVTMNKFFSPGKQPMMLTHNEKMCIKYLHKEDPVQWNIFTLSESFPAMPEIIQKVLKSKWKPSEERIKQMDVRVKENWKLLKEGKLDARPEVIEHLKKFVNRRELLLENIKSSDFYLPEVEVKKVWNHGEMSKILESYEKSIEKLEKMNLNKLDTKLISDREKNEVKQENNLSQREPINSTRYDKSNEKFIIEEKEGITLGKMLQQFADPMTEQELRNPNFNKFGEKNQNQGRKAILQQQLYDESKMNLNNRENRSKSDCESHEEGSRLPKKGNISLPKALLKKETTLRIEEEFKADQITERDHKNLQSIPFLTDELARKLIVGEKTSVTTEFHLGKVLNKSENNVPPTRKSVLRFEKLVENDPERLERDKLYNEKIVDEIKDTAFWNSGKSAKPKPMIEFEKKNIGDPQDIDKVTKMDVCSSDSYPEKIIIPKEKRGSGLIYKVKDCYYDDDGEFLYRVPGMIN